jgi:quinol monooxygenase YgiN
VVSSAFINPCRGGTAIVLNNLSLYCRITYLPLTAAKDIQEDNMVRVVAPNYIKPEEAKTAEPLFREIIAATRKEKGCIEYRLFTKKDEPGLYVFIEEWETQADLDNHIASEHFKRIIPQLGKLKSKDGSALVMEEEFK